MIPFLRRGLLVLALSFLAACSGPTAGPDPEDDSEPKDDPNPPSGFHRSAGIFDSGFLAL